METKISIESNFTEYKEAFLEENEVRIENIKKYKKELNMEDYAILVHALKSDAKYLGFTNLAEIAYEHELASKANNVDEVNKKYDVLVSTTIIENGINIPNANTIIINYNIS